MMSAGVATVVTLMLSFTPSNGGSVNAPVITINDQAGSQYDPHIDGIEGDLAAYSYSLDTLFSLYEQIRYYRFSTNQDLGIPNQLPDGSYVSDLLSDIQQNRILFSRLYADRNALMMFDTTTGVTTELAPTPGSNRLGVAVGGPTVAFIDFAPAGDGTGELFVLDLNTNQTQQLTNDHFLDSNPSVSPEGRVIAWERCPTFTNCDIYTMRRLSDGSWQPAAVGTSTLDEGAPDTNGDLVVWHRTSSTTSDLVIAPVGGGTETVINLPGLQFNPTIRGRIVAFENSPTPGSPPDIWVLDLDTQRVFQVTNTVDYGETLNDVTQLSTGEVRVVWEARNDPGDPTFGNIYAATFVLPSNTGTGTGGGAGGGAGGTGGGHGSGSGSGSGSTCLARDVTLEATRVYSPTRATDGSQTFTPAFSFAIPSEIPVVAGNAGNKKVVLTVDLGGTRLRCRYRGGSPKAHPTSPQDIAAGTRYLFEGCSDAACNDDDDGVSPVTQPSYGPGTIVTASAIALHVQGGDSRKPLTRVRLQLAEECFGVAAAPLESGADSLGPTGVGCSSTSTTLVPVLAALAIVMMLRRRPASIRLVARQERRTLSR
jgi:hypothetical protein